MGHSYWLVLLSASTFFVGYEDLADRSSLVSTYFLSLIAFMFVVDESLPKLDFATRIDKVIMVSVSLVPQMKCTAGIKIKYHACFSFIGIKQAVLSGHLHYAHSECFNDTTGAPQLVRWPKS